MTDSSNQPAGPKSGDVGWRFVGLVSVLMATATVLYDALAILPYELVHVRTLWFLLMPLAAKMVICVAAYWLGWLLLRVLLRSCKDQAGPVSIGLAVFMVLCYRLHGLHLDIDLPGILARGQGVAVGAGIIVTGLVFAITAYRLARRMFGSKAGTAVAAMCLAIPFVLLETSAWVWLNKHKLEQAIVQHVSIREELLSGPVLAINVGYVVAVIVTLILLMSLRRGPAPRRLMLGLTAVIFAGSALVLAGVLGRTRPADSNVDASHPIRRVVLIVADTLRADALTCYGGQGKSTPAIDALAGESVLFEKAYAPAPWTIASLGSIMTGLSPLVHNITEIDSNLPDAFDTLAERMRDEGYLTWAIGSNLLVRRRNLEQGFTGFDFFPRRADRSGAGMVLAELMPGHFTCDASTSDITDRTIDWLGKNGDQDFFLWVHYFDPHEPYAPPAEFLPPGQPPTGMATSFSELVDVRGGWRRLSQPQRKWARALYDSEVSYVDANVGRLLADLQQKGLYEDSLIILTSDHGEEFWEHDGFDHGHSLYNELLWVPLIVKLPGSITAGRVTEPVSLESIMPTVLDLSKVQYAREHLSAGSLAAYFEDPEASGRAEPIIGSAVVLYEEQESVLFDDIKYIRRLASGKEELYDLEFDPGETRSILSAAQDKAAAARAILRKRHVEADRLQKHYQTTGEQTAMDSDTAERLRALGYVR